MTVIIVTSEYEGVVESVHSKLSSRGIEPWIIDPSDFTQKQISLMSPDYMFRLKKSNGKLFEVGPDTKIWLRRPRMPRPEAYSSGSEQIREFQSKSYISLWNSAFSAPALWMNPYLSARALEGNKVLQASYAEQSGLLPIPTLLTDSPEEFEMFVIAAGGEIAVKAPFSWHGLIDGSSDPHGTYTRRLDPSAAILLADHVRLAPVLVQPYIDKEYELRITVVGKKIFACKIDSQASSISNVDWRHYDFNSVTHESIVLESGIQSSIIRFMEESNLKFAAIDMIVDPDGRHWFVEVNPSGEYGWIESLTEMPISEEIANWLTGEI